MVWLCRLFSVCGWLLPSPLGWPGAGAMLSRLLYLGTVEQGLEESLNEGQGNIPNHVPGTSDVRVRQERVWEFCLGLLP